jgi:hypothetical protein
MGGVLLLFELLVTDLALSYGKCCCSDDVSEIVPAETLGT